MLTSIFAHPAVADDSPPPDSVVQDSVPEDTEVSLAAYGIYEVWENATIAEQYGQSRVSVGASADVDVTPQFFGRLAMAFTRMGGGEDSEDSGPSVEVLPITLGGGFCWDRGAVEIRPSTGVTIVQFTESGTSDGFAGKRLGLDTQLEVRLPAGLSLPTLAEDTRIVRRSEVAFFVGRRATGEVVGSVPSAWRLGVGIVGIL